MESLQLSSPIGDDGIGNLFNWYDSLVRSIHGMHFRELPGWTWQLFYDSNDNLSLFKEPKVYAGLTYEYYHDLNRGNPFHSFHDLLAAKPSYFFRIDIDTEHLMTYPSFLE